LELQRKRGQVEQAGGQRKWGTVEQTGGKCKVDDSSDQGQSGLTTYTSTSLWFRVVSYIRSVELVGNQRMKALMQMDHACSSPDAQMISQDDVRSRLQARRYEGFKYITPGRVCDLSV
jgi:hypothetical protein